jgi:hypothetical protein
MRADTFERAVTARRAVRICRPEHAGHQIASVEPPRGPFLRVLCGCGERLKISDLEMCAKGVP